MLWCVCSPFLLSFMDGVNTVILSAGNGQVDSVPVQGLSPAICPGVYGAETLSVN